MNEEQKNHAEKAYSWLTSLLSGWGIKQSWAQYIAAALVGAIVAIASVSGLAGCTATASQNADGSWSYSGEIVTPIIKDVEVSDDKK